MPTINEDKQEPKSELVETKLVYDGGAGFAYTPTPLTSPFTEFNWCVRHDASDVVDNVIFCSNLDLTTATTKFLYSYVGITSPVFGSYLTTEGDQVQGLNNKAIAGRVLTQVDNVIFPFAYWNGAIRYYNPIRIPLTINAPFYVMVSFTGATPSESYFVMFKKI